MNFKLSTILSLFTLVACTANAQIISIADFGLEPNTRENAIPYINKAIEECKKQKGSTLFFPEGRYDFWPQHAIEREYFESNSTDINPKRLAFLFENIDNLTLDGGGSTFIMHDRIQPVTTDNSSNIKLKNFTVDWDRPLMSQGIIKEVGNDYFEVEIDKRAYPYIIENEKVQFVGEGWKSGISSIMEFDAQTHIIQNGDGALGGSSLSKAVATEIKEGLIRIQIEGGFARSLAKGNICVFRHNKRDHAGIFLLESKNIELSNITIHHTAGLGILSQYTENISFDNVNVIPNKAKGRYFSGHDDGFHFMGCKGQITVNNCEWLGLMDDPVNIHGTCVRITEILAPNKVKCEFMHHQSQGLRWAVATDKVGLIDNKSMATIANNKVKSFDPINTNSFVLETETNLPKELAVGMALENLTWTPDIHIQNSRFLSCRARGLLITTPGKVVIENNHFESSGSAILIAGDANQWYESGAVTDVTIKNNTFHYSCLSSAYQFTEAIISIEPEIPELDAQKPYHRNIVIENNTFNPFDYPILHARSVDGLTFQNNTIERSNSLKPFHWRKSGFSLIGCKNVSILNNNVIGDVLGKDIILEKMSKKEVKLSKGSYFKIK